MTISSQTINLGLEKAIERISAFFVEFWKMTVDSLEAFRALLTGL